MSDGSPAFEREPNVVVRRLNKMDFIVDHPSKAVGFTGDREQADADHAAAIGSATLLIVGVLSFAAGALTLAAIAFVLVHW